LEQEIAILDSQGDQHPLEALKPCIELAELRFLQKQVRQVRISTEIKHYIVSIVAATRSSDEVKLGASPRASLTLMKCAQALSLLDGYDFVTPDAVQELAIPVIAHRLGLDSQSKFSGTDAELLLKDIVHNIPIPA